jgi:rhombotail lipoprotein
MVDASVFDVSSQKLLFRAAGSDRIQGRGTAISVNADTRTAQINSYDKAVADLIPHLQSEMGAFKSRAREDANVRIENRAGYSGQGGAVDWWSLLLLGSAGVLLMRATRRGTGL